jgi:uncharacterized protein with NRDE domain
VCTVALRFTTRGRWRIRLVAIRDEFYSRGTLPPAAHWRGHDLALVGALDLRAGGTSLAVPRERRAVAVLVNAPPHRPEAFRGERPVRTRGTLPLLAAAGQDIASASLCGLPGFHLLSAVADNATMCDTVRASATDGEGTNPRCIVGPVVELLSWNGAELTHRRVEPGDHVLTSAGLDVEGHERSARVRAVLSRVPRNSPVGSTSWQSVACAGIAEDQDLPGGRYGTVGAAVIALSSQSVHYAVSARPGRAAWGSVLPGDESLRGSHRSDGLATAHAAEAQSTIASNERKQ